MKRIIYTLFAVGLLVSCNSKKPQNSEVVATNAWTAAYALAAGATDVRVLTPYEMTHPSEYELRSGDIIHLNNAEIIIYAGYEVMLEQIRTGLKIPEEKMLQIYTSYKMDEIEKSVMQIAQKLNTEELATKNLGEIRASLEDVRQRVAESGLDTTPAVVHFFQQSLVTEAGIEILAVFGPAPPEARQILEMTQTNASLIIDNAHNPSGGALRETMPDANYVMLLNFPGLHDTRTLVDVIEYNARQLQTLNTRTVSVNSNEIN